MAMFFGLGYGKVCTAHFLPHPANILPPDNDFRSTRKCQRYDSHPSNGRSFWQPSEATPASRHCKDDRVTTRAGIAVAPSSRWISQNTGHLDAIRGPNFSSFPPLQPSDRVHSFDSGCLATSQKVHYFCSFRPISSVTFNLDINCSSSPYQSCLADPGRPDSAIWVSTLSCTKSRHLIKHPIDQRFLPRVYHRSNRAMDKSSTMEVGDASEDLLKRLLQR